MKTDLTTSIIAAIVGTVAAYFVCNLLVPKIESFTLTSLSSDTDYTLTEPNVEVFNYRSVNPTVEVYVGNCTGDNCETAIIIDEETEEKPEETPEEPSTEEETEQEPGENQEPENGTTD
ncbi:hypothetical protein J5868_01295 [Candidatus Saccharibacteria bacterium]|nr:hypothetical protein [Candidatus Saccharibacteria bacterium]MBQ1539976.1 hypothetical protein [Candidatus Saccharibacteria bacterium]